MGSEGGPPDGSAERPAPAIRTGAASSPTALPDTDWRGLQPASLAVNLVPDLWRTFKGVWPLLLAAVLGGPVAGVNLGLIALFFAMSVGRTVSHFLTVRYRWSEGRLQIRSGLIARQFRVIDPSRIQNVEIVRGVFHKLAGLVELRVETAGERGAEGLLSAISEAEARDLQARLYGAAAAAHGPAARGAAGPTAPAPEVLHAMTAAELVGYGVSAGRVGAALLVAGVLMEWGGLLAPALLRDALREVRAPIVIGVLLFALAGAYATSVLGATVRHYGFRVLRSPRGVRIEGGLFTTRGVEIPLAKVQLLRVEEPLVRRAMGYASLHVETAAMGAPEEELVSEGFVPMVADVDLPHVARLVLPALDVDPWEQRLRPPASRALRRAVVARTLRWALLGGIAAAFTGYSALLALAAVGPVLAWSDWRTQGWWLSERHVVARRGVWPRETWVLPRGKIQSVHLQQGPLQRWHGLAAVEVWAAGTRVVLPDLDAPEARRLFETLVSG
jgi:putative membrane protein